MCLLIADNTRGSCMMGHSLIFTLSDSSITRLAVKNGRKRRLWEPAFTIPWPYFSGCLYLGTHRVFCVFIADQCPRGITATSRECLSGDWSETRNTPETAHLCAPKSWKLCWNGWEPLTASAVGITRTSPISQQTPVSAHTRMCTGNIRSL
jgi:hypothetical protein